MLTALIVDDEPLALTRLWRPLESLGVVVIGEAGDAADGLRMAEELKPDALFLDIQMPEITGMEAAARLPRRDAGPALVFVTGYSEYAVAAFEKRALDYLVKPVTVERLAQAVARVREHSANRRAPRSPSGRSLNQQALRSLPVRVDYVVRLLPWKRSSAPYRGTGRSLSSRPVASTEPTTRCPNWKPCCLPTGSCASMISPWSTWISSWNCCFLATTPTKSASPTTNCCASDGLTIRSCSAASDFALFQPPDVPVHLNAGPRRAGAGPGHPPGVPARWWTFLARSWPVLFFGISQSVWKGKKYRAYGETEYGNRCDLRTR